MILELHSPLDMHLHLRDGDMLKLVAPLSSASFAGAVIMPNLVPPVADADAVQAYRQRVLDACGDDVFRKLPCPSCRKWIFLCWCMAKATAS